MSNLMEKDFIKCPCIGCTFERQDKRIEPCATKCDIRHQYADCIEESFCETYLQSETGETDIDDDDIFEMSVSELLEMNIIGSVFDDYFSLSDRIGLILNKIH